MNCRKSILASLLVALTISIAACGGSGGNSPNPPAAISVSFAGQPPSSLVIGTTLSLTAIVGNDASNAGVTWTATCGGTQCGSFNPAATANSAATTYTAPATVPTGNSVTLVATSVTDHTKTASATVTITAAATAVLPDGTYVFSLAGEDITQSGSPYFVAGAFTVLNKTITGGEQDFVDLGTGSTDNILAAGSSLSTTSNGNIEIVLATDDISVGVNGVETLRGTSVSSSRALITEFDGFASASGTLDLQTGTAAPSGGYAFNLSGLDGSSSPNTLVVGGILNITGTSLTVGSSIFDFNDSGTIGLAQSFASGTVSVPDAFGRISISLTPTSNNFPQFGLSGYIVGPNKIQLVEDLLDTLNGVLGGTALGQGANTGNFTQSGVAGSTYVFTASGVDGAGLAHIGGSLTLNANGSVTGTIALNDLNTFGSQAITAGNWTVGSGGRVVITNLAPSLVQGVPFAFQLYLDGNGNALQLGVDTSEATAGLSYLQSATTVNAASYAIGAQGFANATGAPFWAANGPVTIDGSGNLTGSTDYNIFGAAPLPAVALTGTSNAGLAQFNIAGLNALSFTTANQFLYFPIDSSRVLAIQTDGNQLGLIVLEKVGP